MVGSTARSRKKNPAMGERDGERMRLATLGALQSLLLSVHTGQPVIIDTSQWFLDATFVLTNATRFPLVTSLLLKDPHLAPVALLAWRPFDPNSTVVQTMAYDVIPQLARHESPDPLLVLSVFACLEVLRSNDAKKISVFSVLGIFTAELSTAAHHDAFAYLAGGLGLLTCEPAIFAVLIAIMVYLERDSVHRYVAHLSTLALLASEPVHASALRLLPEVIEITQDWPTSIRNPLIRTVADSLEFADQIGGGLLKTYLQLMQDVNVH
jgi:hypothetical protein